MTQQFNSLVYTQIESRALKRYLCALFIEALFTIPKTQKQLKYPMMDDWINNVVYT